MNYYFLLSLFIIFISIETLQGRSIETGEKSKKVGFIYKDKKWGEKSKLNKSEDGYTMVFVNTTMGEVNGLFKREGEGEGESEEAVVSSVMDEIYSLIINNRDTFKNITQLEEIEKSDSNLRKRQNENELVDYGDSNLVYPISSNNGCTVLFAYLSDPLMDAVENIPSVMSCTPNYNFEYHTNFSEKQIKKEAKWKDMIVRYNADLHLSLVSQGKYDSNLVHEYDTNYYFPKSAGKGINMIFFDSGFNFNSGEFGNSSGRRIIKCAFNVTSGKVIPVANEKYCHSSSPFDHGSIVADSAAGLEHGVARKANIYGVLFNELNTGNVIAALQYVKDNLLVPYKTVINCSFGESFPLNQENDALVHVEGLLNDINDMGGVVVVSAGNDGINVNDPEKNSIYYPCAFNNTICVGGTDNIDLASRNYDLSGYVRTNLMNSPDTYKRFQYSNYGKEVNIYAPFFVHVAFLDHNYNYIDGIDGGTSFSSPIVAGIAATIMSENPSIQFNTKKMLQYLTKLGEKNILSNIHEGHPNVFANNGKRVVYSSDNTYQGCGVYAGYRKCPIGECCSSKGQCTNDKQICRSDKGCQVNSSSVKTCLFVKSSIEGKCGNGIGSCPKGYCCSSEGTCGKSNDFCGVGCQINYGKCK